MLFSNAETEREGSCETQIGHLTERHGQIQDSLDLDDLQGLQDKVFIDIMLYFCNRGRENLCEMTRDSFEVCEEGRKRYITLKDTNGQTQESS